MEDEALLNTNVNLPESTFYETHQVWQHGHRASYRNAHAGWMRQNIVPSVQQHMTCQNESCRMQARPKTGPRGAHRALQHQALAKEHTLSLV